MKLAWFFQTLIALILVLSACSASPPTAILISTPSPDSLTTAVVTQPTSSDTPCIGLPAPARWNHIVILMFENKTYDEVIGPAPYITGLADKCATALDWKDANFKVDGSRDGKYNSKPNYATLTSGLSPSAHRLLNDKYNSMTDVDNIYHQLYEAGLAFKDYYDGEPGGCDVRFSGDYHDPIRYYTNVASICSEHDVPLSTFIADVNNGSLPAFSMILPTKGNSMHDNSVASGDAYARSILEPLLNSEAYARGDVAIFFLWDENTPIPNVLMAPSVTPGTRITVPDGNPVSHFSALRTWEEMLDLPLLGDTGSAPSLLPYFEGSEPGH